MRSQLSLPTSPLIRFKSRHASHAASAQRKAPDAPVSPERFDSEALLRGTREVLIQHGDEVYRLRHTRNDKLILTK